MSDSLVVLTAALIVNGVLAILYSVLDLEKAKRLDRAYHQLRKNRKLYNFDRVTKRRKFLSYYFTIVSALGIGLSFVVKRIVPVFNWIIIISLACSIYYTYPVKKSE